MQAPHAVTALRKPEYTGENRCLPCTILNVVLVTAVAVALVAWIGPTAGIVAGTVGLGLIYVRGYAVPGTPFLTQTFLPNDVLEYVEHGGQSTDTQTADGGNKFDPETELLEAGALAPCPDRDDLCMAPPFRKSWRSEMAPVAEEIDEAVYQLVPPSFDEPVEVVFRGKAVLTQVADTTVAEWPSRAAFVADVAGAIALADTDQQWADREFAERTKLLAGLRLWLDRCSVCDGHVELSEGTVETCCRSLNQVEASCTSCAALIFEAQLPAE
jgi:hypothetical protein